MNLLNWAHAQVVKQQKRNRYLLKVIIVLNHRVFIHFLLNVFCHTDFLAHIAFKLFLSYHNLKSEFAISPEENIVWLVFCTMIYYIHYIMSCIILLWGKYLNIYQRVYKPRKIPVFGTPGRCKKNQDLRIKLHFNVLPTPKVKVICQLGSLSSK